MCYDTAQLAYKIYKDAVRMNASPEEIPHLKQKWESLKDNHQDLYHACGFDHPDLVVFSMNDGHIDFDIATWGLVPSWIPSEEKKRDIWNRTIIARGETMFEKPSFKEAASTGRCIVPVDGFFEHHHKQNKTVPYFIEDASTKRILLGGLMNTWLNPLSGESVTSFAIVTTKANALMTEIHNNPKIPESRMPLLLNEGDVDTWLNGTESEVQSLIKPNTTIELNVKTVHPIRGKNYIGNSPEIHEPYSYDNPNGQTSLFE